MNTVAPDFLYVSEHVARNPVACAIARNTLTEAVRDFQTRLYLLADGENVQADIMAAARVLAVALAIRDKAGRGGDPDARVMAGAMGQCTDISRRRFIWKTTDAVAIDVGLQRAVDVYCKASAQQIQDAHRHVIRLEQRA